MAIGRFRFGMPRFPETNRVTPHLNLANEMLSSFNTSNVSGSLDLVDAPIVSLDTTVF